MKTFFDSLDLRRSAASGAGLVAGGVCCLLMVHACRTVEEGAGVPQGLDRAAFTAADADEDGALNPEELARYLHREALAEFDLSGDGLITAEEWALAKPSAGENDPLFREIDADGDGRIAEDEAVAYLLGLEGFQQAFERLDQDGDGRLDWKEIKAGEPEIWQIGLFSGSEEPTSD